VYVFVTAAGFPHGVFPVSELLCISLMLRVWPGLRVYSIAASSVFSVPVWRHIMAWTGARPATRRWFRKLLQQVGPGAALSGSRAFKMALGSCSQRQQLLL
jgi:1-acyl-sn-glycerol-3-phosphate acyltransferase